MGGGLDVALAEDHGAGVRAVDVSEEGRGAVARGGALADVGAAVVAVVGGHFGVLWLRAIVRGVALRGISLLWWGWCFAMILSGESLC